MQNLAIEDRHTIRTITIDRPDKLNALNRQTLEELDAAMAAVEADAGVRVVILRGAGDKAFVAGADIAELAALNPVQARDFSRLGQRLMRRIETCGKPVLAMIQGFALGGGMELAMSCHLRIAGTRARFGQPEVQLGVIPGFGGTQRLLRLAGRSAALELCLGGAQIDASRALALNLVHRVVADEALLTETMTLAEHLATLAPQALRGVIDAVVIGGECGLDVGLDYETLAFSLCVSTQDMREGTSAFLQRRKPQFTGT